MNGALSKGAREKKEEPSRGTRLVQGALVKTSKLEKGWEEAREGKKEKRSNFFTYLGRRVKDQGLHYPKKLKNRLALEVNSSRGVGPFWKNAAPLTVP